VHGIAAAEALVHVIVAQAARDLNAAAAIFVDGLGQAPEQWRHHLQGSRRFCSLSYPMHHTPGMLNTPCSTFQEC
jgi:hypothetical protein